MPSARTIIERAARKIHVLGRGQTLSPDEANDALIALNGFLGTFSAETTTIYNSVIETFPLTGAQSYTIGTGGNFNTVRPVAINSVYVRSGSTDYPVTEMNSDQYSAIATKYILAIPEQFYYDNNSPLGNIFFYPAGIAPYTVTIDSLKPLTAFADLTTVYTLPDGFEDMLVYNLAINLCPDYEKEPTPFLMMMAKKTKRAIETYTRRQNYPVSTLDPVGETSSDGNIYSGYAIR